MRRRWLILALGAVLIAGGGVGAAAASTATAPADTPPSTASFTASDDVWGVSGAATNETVIAPGGTVSFGYPSGGIRHNADFSSGPPPTSCTQTAGTDGGAVPPLPHVPTAPGWAGTCTFDAPGTYTFHCDLHSFMTGTIVVSDTFPTTSTATTTTTPTTSTATTTTTASTTTTVQTTTSAPTTTTGPPGSDHRPGRPLTRLAIAANQHGTTVHGSLTSATGGRATVALSTVRRRHIVRWTRRHLAARTVSFALHLDRTARRALRRAGHLKLSVTVTVISPQGVKASVTRRVRMRD